MAKKVLLLGATGHLGQILLSYLLENNYKVIALVRNPKKLNREDKNLEILKGSPTNKPDLINALKNVDVVISALGHGFRTKYLVQKNTLSLLIPLMENQNISRFITVTGSGLNTEEDEKSQINNLTEKIFTLIDPYRMKDALDQQDLLKRSSLNWTVVRTPIHSSSKVKYLRNVGYKKPAIWNRVGRIAISSFIIKCIEENIWIKKSPIIF